MMQFIIITPVRNEEQYIRVTIECMLSQTLLPSKWIIVNDGSTDETEKIVMEYIKKASFIDYLYISNRGYRKPAKGVIEAFYEGFKRVENIDHDIISKFDADLKFPPDSLERICNAFSDNPKLGITGGTRYEQIDHKGTFKKVPVPKGFVGGPFKFYRRKCFEDIGGLIKRAGWDGVDTIMANMKGWETGEIDKLKIIHLRPTGTAKGEGLKIACKKYGDVSYFMGGYVWYFLLRVIGRSLYGYNLKIGYYMIQGYLTSMLNKETRESEEFRRYLKSVQIQNVAFWLKQGIKLSSKSIL